MSNHVQNPSYKPSHELQFTDAQWDALKALVQAVLDANSASPTVKVSDLRAVSPLLRVSDDDDPQKMRDRNWAQLSSDMGLGPELPEPRA